MCLKEQRYGFRSHGVAAGAMMGLQEPRFGFQRVGLAPGAIFFYHCAQRKGSDLAY